ncbi:DeoR/GlpR family DNA-binding transcription regulator [Bacteroides pyogenes]|uniref:DeoR/GlpR family DNA-binding transcription regulator n=1 Tax=Bacteroides pyogenes TaxID=310300 RepID=UPI0037356926
MRNAIQRHKFILEQLKEKGCVKVLELSDQLNVSEVTIRKDLQYLEDRKLLIRYHGSASTPNLLISDTHIDIKEKLHTEEKERIAKAANKLLKADDKIIIASGTTLLAFAKNIEIQGNLTVITSAIKVSLALCYSPNIEVIQLGGIMRKSSASVIGHFAENILETFSCNKLFIGVDGIDLNHGFTTSNANESYINQQMIAATDEVIVLTDSSKFEKRGFSKICDLNKVSRIITDTNAPAYMVEVLKKRGIEIILV